MKALVIFALLTASAATEDRQLDLTNSSQLIAPKDSFQSSLIVNGRLARRTQFPYQVGLMLDSGNGGEMTWCGGTLISRQWVLTAAHCTDSVVEADVYLGAFDRTNPKEPGQRRIHVNKSNIIVHENWDQKEFTNDISLIKLPSPVRFNSYIRPARLPKKSGNYSDYVGAKTIASGWGKIKDSDNVVTNKLRWIKVPIMPNSECAPYFNHPVVNDAHICLRAEKAKSVCNGDSGGPLILADGSRTVIGATSFGLDNSCEKSFPGVFTRVTSYLDWIAEHTGIVNK